MKTPSGIRYSALIVLSVFPLLSCCRKHVSQSDHETRAVPTILQMVDPAPNTVIHCGDSVKITFVQADTSIRLDSAAVYNGRHFERLLKGSQRQFYWNSGNSRTGRTTLRVVFYLADTLQESHNINLVVLSDLVPVTYKYRIIAKYPHDDQAYTQGLIYDKGILYESTGLEGKSTLRIVNLKDGKPVKTVSLASQYFGEGISIFEDKIYQVTYRTKVGFVYDKNTLQQERTFDYQINEGWGLTTDGKNLIMSDGSDQLFFIEPEFFTQVDMIQVFDNRGMIDSLNELEYVDGTILANVYGQTYIVFIDPETGKVTGKADFRDIMPEGSIGNYNRVLNGIAFNPATHHLYITGKNWPVLYEIELIPSL